MGMVGARELLPGEAPALHCAVERLAARAGVVRPRLYVLARRVSARALGAAAARRAAPALAVSTGLLGVATPAELEGIVAHELAHLRHRDVLVQTTRGDRSRRPSSRRRGSAASSSARCSSSSARSPRRSCTCCSRRSASSRPTASPPSSATRRTGSPTRCCGSRARWSSSRSRRSPATEPLYIDEPVRRGGPRGAVRHAPAARRARPPAARARPGVARQAARGVTAGEERATGPVSGALVKEMGGVLLSREIALRVPSALAGLTSLFGMGRGVSPPL